ncbi:MAG: Rieske 2Fe-2S domain-containing protein [Gammaproteobacteria bacterium]|nr:Rieske 2Fe-2S domain-containing protein [Gammaproteobacteria bacterium]
MPPSIRRREVIWGLLGLLGWSGRLAPGALASGDTEYLDLKQRISFSLSTLTEIWENRVFEAWVAARGGSDKLLKGLLLRVAEPTQDDTGLRAFCVYCPHEVCEVGLVIDSKTIRLDSGVVPEHPLIVCPCHFSAFNPLDDGVNISGPAFRGLFRFRVITRGDRIHITQVEKSALTLFN